MSSPPALPYFLRTLVFTTGQIAQLCDVTHRTVHKWHAAGLLKGYRLPGSADRRFPRRHVLAFLKDSGMDVPPWLSESPVLVAATASPLPWLEGCLRAWRVERVPDLFAAGVLCAELRPAAALFDLALGRAVCVAAARRLARWEHAPLTVALACEDEADHAGLAAAFAVVLTQPDPAALADALSAVA